MKDRIDVLCDCVKALYNIDLYDIRVKVVNKKQCLEGSKNLWDKIVDLFSEYDASDCLHCVFGGIHYKPVGKSCYELFKK